MPRTKAIRTYEDKQLTIDNLPAEHPVYVIGRGFLNMNQTLENQKNELESQREKLIEAMLAEGKKEINVSGYKLSVKEISAKTTIVIK